MLDLVKDNKPLTVDRLNSDQIGRIRTILDARKIQIPSVEHAVSLLVKPPSGVRGILFKMHTLILKVVQLLIGDNDTLNDDDMSRLIAKELIKRVDSIMAHNGWSKMGNLGFGKAINLIQLLLDEKNWPVLLTQADVTSIVEMAQYLLARDPAGPSEQLEDLGEPSSHELLAQRKAAQVEALIRDDPTWPSCGGIKTMPTIEQYREILKQVEPNLDENPPQEFDIIDEDLMQAS